jgi:hypothetical protein
MWIERNSIEAASGASAAGDDGCSLREGWRVHRQLNGHIQDLKNCTIIRLPVILLRKKDDTEKAFYSPTILGGPPTPYPFQAEPFLKAISLLRLKSVNHGEFNHRRESE